jgi:hypothetical protein
MRSVLNVGGGPGRVLPLVFRGWRQVLLDIDAGVQPDIVLDARRLSTLPPAGYDAVYCSHTLEHFYGHEVAGVLAGFRHVLKPHGFAEVAVPDLGALARDLAAAGGDLDARWYDCPTGPITFHDVLYGWSEQLQRGNLYYAHHCGFDARRLTSALQRAGFSKVYVEAANLELRAVAFLKPPSRERLRQIGVT